MGTILVLSDSYSSDLLGATWWIHSSPQQAFAKLSLNSTQFQSQFKLGLASFLVDYFKATSKLFHGYFEAFLGLLQIYIVAKLSLNLTQFQLKLILRLIST